MTRDDAVSKLSIHADAVRAMGATSLFLYGSTARGDRTRSSDIDLYIDYDATSRFNAFDLVGMKQVLEERLGTVVDLTTRDGLHPRLRDRIELSAVQIF